MKVISPLLVLIFCVSIRAYSTTNHPQTDLTCPEANYFSVDNQNQTVCLPCDNRDNSVYVAKVEAAGGKIVMPKMAVPTIGWLAYAQDTEGTLFGMMQPVRKSIRVLMMTIYSF